VLAVADGVPRPAFSSLFSPEVQAIGTTADLAPATPATRLPAPPAAEIVAGLPLPQVERSDPAAGYLATFAGLSPAQRIVALTLAVAGDPTIPREVTESAETRLALARARIDVGDYQAAATVLADLAADDPSDWRVAWYNGLRDLAAGEPGGAQTAPGAFSAVFDELPGELAPKLALAFAAEIAGDPTTAKRYYRLVWTVDRSYISAAFGLARTSLATGDRSAAIAALAAVPASSSHYAAAQIAAVRILVSGDGHAHVNGDDLRQAGGQLGRLAVDEVRRQQLTVEILRAALDWCTSGQPTGGGPILGCEPSPRAVRFGLERSYRALARLTPDQARRVELIDMANAIRPRTLT
jgi:serine/threonine-protein kinase PknG